MEREAELRERQTSQVQPEALEAAKTSLDALLEVCRDHRPLGEDESFTGLMANIVTAMPEAERVRPVERVVAKRLTSVLGEPPADQRPERGRSMLAMAVIADRILSVSQRGDAVVGRLLAMNLLAYMPPKEAAGMLVGEGAGVETIRAQVSPILRQVLKTGWEVLAPRVHELLYAPDATPEQFLDIQAEIAANAARTKRRERFLGKSAVWRKKTKTSDAISEEFFEEEEFDSMPPHLSDDALGDYLNMAGRTKLLNKATEVVLAKRIEAGLAAAHILESEDELVAMAERSGVFTDEIPLEERDRLVRQLRRDLRAVANEGERARDRFIRANLLLVVAIARRRAVVRRDVPMLDLIQCGNEGLVKAVDRFDHAKGYKFSTYAPWWIRREMDKGIYTELKSTGETQEMFRLLSKLPSEERRLSIELGKRPTPEQLAQALEITVEGLKELRELKANSQIRLDMPIAQDFTLLDVLADSPGDDSVEGLFEAAGVEELRESVEEALAHLPERDADILRFRYNSEMGKERSYPEVAEQFGLSSERIRQIEIKWFEFIREEFPWLSGFLGK